jgi:hypothetical protein
VLQHDAPKQVAVEWVEPSANFDSGIVWLVWFSCDNYKKGLLARHIYTFFTHQAVPTYKYTYHMYMTHRLGISMKEVTSLSATRQPKTAPQNTTQTAAREEGRAGKSTDRLLP